MSSKRIQATTRGRAQAKAAPAAKAARLSKTGPIKAGSRLEKAKVLKTSQRDEAPKRADNSLKAVPSGSSSRRAGTEFRLEPKLLVQIHDLMVKARVLEERLTQMYKKSDGYFWIGGPGEEAFQVPLALQARKGQGKDHDFWHLHYRSSPIMITLGMDPMDAIRQMKNTSTDPFSGGRNFCNHFSRKAWNVAPVTSTIETQYQTAIGTGIAQKRHGGKGITIVNGGDAGTAEGDFASCLVWASRPNKELPILILVAHNEWGISTPANTQHGDKRISDRGKAFGMKTMYCDGNDVEEAWFAIKEATDYIRAERKPVLLEYKCSRLYGHSSATGANFVPNEVDCLAEFEKRLEGAGILSRKKMDELREKYGAEMLEMSKRVKDEPMPEASTIYDHVYAGQKGKYW
jgi:2-oxoisovalerate dehydrogenase E1 component alpha subunit